MTRDDDILIGTCPPTAGVCRLDVDDLVDPREAEVTGQEIRLTLLRDEEPEGCFRLSVESARILARELDLRFGAMRGLARDEAPPPPLPEAELADPPAGPAPAGHAAGLCDRAESLSGRALRDLDWAEHAAASGRLVVSRADLADPEFMREYQPAIARASRAGRLEFAAGLGAHAPGGADPGAAAGPPGRRSPRAVG